MPFSISLNSNKFVFLDPGKVTLSVHDMYEGQEGMMASTPHPRAPVQFPLVENICIIYNNIPIYQKKRNNALRF